LVHNFLWVIDDGGLTSQDHNFRLKCLKGNRRDTKAKGEDNCCSRVRSQQVPRLSSSSTNLPLPFE
jgi:hypothetical protein